MPKIDFSSFPYFPHLCCSEGEHMGYRRLSDTDKDALLPVFELGQRRHEPDLDLAVEEIRVSAGERKFLLELSKQPSPPPFEQKDAAARAADAVRIRQQRDEAERYNALLSGLLSPADGFAAWRAMAGKFPNCIPVLQYQDPAKEQAEILKQAKHLAGDANSIAIRITEATSAEIFPTLAALYAMLGNPERLLVIVDAGAGRVRISQRQEFVAATMASIVQQVPLDQQSQVRAICVSSSFPAQTKDDLTPYDACEWDIWSAAREVAPVMFGDYAAMHRLRKQNTYVPNDWRATVVYPLNEGWLVYRDPNANREEGWTEGSEKIRADAAYQPELRAWGTEIIARAASGDIKGVDSARFWHAVKVNLHLHRQVRHAQRMLSEFDTDE